MPDSDSILSPGGYPGQDGITREQGYEMIVATAADAEKRQQGKTLAELEEYLRSPEFAEHIRKHNEEQTPDFGNRCKTVGCKGTVVKRVTGMFRGHISYGVPQCEACHRVYLNAVDAPGVGVDVFLKQLQQPTTM
jgi:hypothetical protein